MLRYSAAICVILAAILASCSIISQKISIEAHNHAVELCMDYNDVKNLAATKKIAPAAALKQLHQAGINSIALEMDTLATAASKGRVIQHNPGEYELTGYSNLTLIPKLFDMVLGDKVSVTIYGSGITIKYDNSLINKDIIENIPIGFYDTDLNTIKNAGLIIVGRIPAFQGAQIDSINTILEYLQILNINQILFYGDTIVGFRSSLKDLGREMKNRKMFFGKIEFAKQKGEQTIAEENLEYLIQVHSISDGELSGMSPDTACERYVKAVRERNVRLLFVRPIDKSAPLNDTCRYFESLSKEIGKAGYQIKPVHKMNLLPANRQAKAIAAAGAGMLVVLLFAVIFKIAPVYQTVAAIITCGLFGFMGWYGGVCIKIITLILGICSPVLAIACAVKQPSTGNLKKGNLFTAFTSVLIAFGITIISASINLALLSSNSYIMRNEVYAGVKAAHFLPLILKTLLCTTGALWIKHTIKDSIRKQQSVFRRITKKHITYGVTILGFALLIVIGLMLARSGNDAGIGVSPLELKLRSILDKIVYVRPRSKEFLLGYPAMLLGFFFLFRNNKIAGSIFTALGTIALISLFNTFCHIHTPVIISLIRAANGLWCGLLVGFAAYIILVRPTIKKKNSK